MQTQSQNWVTISKPLVSSNDDSFNETFDDVKHMFMPFEMILPRKAYSEHERPQEVIDRRFRSLPNKERPVWMPGSKDEMLRRYRTKKDFYRTIANRYVRRFKINVTTHNEGSDLVGRLNGHFAEKWGMHLNSGIEYNYFFSDLFCRITLNGKEFDTSEWPNERWSALRRLQQQYNRFVNMG